MDAIFERLLGNNFSELVGLTLDASIPVTEQLANEIIESALQGNPNITYCRVAISRENRVRVSVKSPRWPWPVDLKLKLFRNVDFTDSPRVRAFLENNILLGKLGALFKALPDGITIYENQISVDIGSFLHTQQQKRLLDLVKSVEIKTEEGKVIFDIKAGVDGER